MNFPHMNTLLELDILKSSLLNLTPFYLSQAE